jgi:hypothetical protein
MNNSSDGEFQQFATQVPCERFADPTEGRMDADLDDAWNHFAPRSAADGYEVSATPGSDGHSHTHRPT